MHSNKTSTGTGRLKSVQLDKNPNGDRTMKGHLVYRIHSVSISRSVWKQSFILQHPSSPSAYKFSVRSACAGKISKPSKARNSDRTSLFCTFGYNGKRKEAMGTGFLINCDPNRRRNSWHEVATWQRQKCEQKPAILREPVAGGTLCRCWCSWAAAYHFQLSCRAIAFQRIWHIIRTGAISGKGAWNIGTVTGTEILSMVL